jgi:hypothetical protein
VGIDAGAEAAWQIAASGARSRAKRSWASRGSMRKDGPALAGLGPALAGRLALAGGPALAGLRSGFSRFGLF